MSNLILKIQRKGWVCGVKFKKKTFFQITLYDRKNNNRIIQTIFWIETFWKKQRICLMKNNK